MPPMLQANKKGILGLFFLLEKPRLTYYTTVLYYSNAYYSFIVLPHQRCELLNYVFVLPLIAVYHAIQ